jgi:hypothetical protein
LAGFATNFDSASAVCDSEEFQILCVQWGRIHLMACGCKWNLLKVSEGKDKRNHGGLRWNLRAESMPLFSKCFKNFHKSMEKGRPGDSHPIINECGGVWVVPSQVKVVPKPEHGQFEM